MLVQFQVKEVFDAIAPAVALSVGSAVGQSSIADEISSLIRKPKQELYPTIDDEYVQMEPQTKVDILIATPGRLMDHINMTKGFSLEHLQYLVGLLIIINMCFLHNLFSFMVMLLLLTLLEILNTFLGPFSFFI